MTDEPTADSPHRAPAELVGSGELASDADVVPDEGVERRVSASPWDVLRGNWLGIAVVVLLAVTAFGSIANWRENKAQNVKYDKIACLSYGFGGGSDVSFIDEAIADVYDCDDLDLPDVGPSQSDDQG